MRFSGLEAASGLGSWSRGPAWHAITVCFVWLAIFVPAQAQTVIDGSEQGLLRGELPLLISVLDRGLTRSDARGAATTARVRGIVQPEPGIYCGKVSTRGPDGEYGPFTRFVVETKIRQATIAPVNDPERIAMIQKMIDARCRSDDGAAN